MNELRTNAKHLSQTEQYQIRKNIIRLLKKGQGAEEVAAMLDVSRSLVYATKKAYDEDASMGSSRGSADAGKVKNGSLPLSRSGKSFK